MEYNVLKGRYNSQKGSHEGESTLDYIFMQCDERGVGHVATSQLVSFLSQLVDGTEYGKQLVEELHALLDPTGVDVEINKKQFREALEEWEEKISDYRPAENIEIIPSVTDHEASNSSEDSDDKIWKSPLYNFNSLNDPEGAKEQLQHSNNELVLQKKWLEEQNASLISILKNSEDSNASLQTNFDNLKEENEHLKLTIEGMKILRAENEELKELLLNSEGKCTELKGLSDRWEQEASSYQKALDELESEKNGLKMELELCISNEKEYIGVIESQSQKLESLTLEKKASEEKLATEHVQCEELQASVESLMMAIKNHQEEKEELEETLAKMQQQYWTSSPRKSSELPSNIKLSPKYVAGLCSYEEVRDECKSLYKDLFSESPAFSSEEPAASIETELKIQEESTESEILSIPEVKSLQESIATYLENLKNFNLCADAMVQVQHSGRGCLSEMTVKDAEEEGDEEHRLRAGEDAWMQFHADEGSEAPSCSCSHEAGHPSPERLRRLQVVREVAALRSQILRSQAVLAALAQSSDLLGVPEAASAARGVSDYGDVYDVGSVGSATMQHVHQPRSMESVAPSLPCVGGRASSGAFGTVGEIAEEGESVAGGECGRGGRRQLTKSCPALTSQVSIATQVDAEDLLTPSSVRAAAEDAAGRGDVEDRRGGDGQSSPKRARSSSFLAAIEGGTLSEEEEEEVFSRLPPPSPSPRHSEDPSRACSVAGTQTNTEESEEGESTAESSEPATEVALVAAVFEPRVDSLDLDEYRSVRKLSVLPEENEEATAGAVDGSTAPASSSTSTSSPQRSSLRRPRVAPPAPPPYRPPPNPYRPHSRSFESYLDPENGLRKREELTGSGGRLGVPRQCSDPTPSASTHLLTTVATVHQPDVQRHLAGDASPGEDLSRSPLRHSSTTRPLELFGGGAAAGKAVRFDGTPSEAMASGECRRKPPAFSHRRLLFPPTSTSPLAEEEETVPQSPRTPDSPGGGGQSEQGPRMDQDQEERDLVAAAAAEADEGDEETMSREAGRRLRIRRRSTPGSPAAVIKRSAAVDYGEGSEDGGGNSSNVVEAEVISPVATSYPSLPDPALSRMGLLSSSNKQEGGGQTLSESLSDQDIENKFTSLSLAFKTDRITLGSRLELQQRQRDLAEKNVLSEIKQLKSTLNCLNHLCTDMETTELLAKIRHQVDVLQHSAQRVSSHAEMYGAVQQESRVSAAIEVMLLHVENLKRLHEKDHGELEDTKRILMENNIVLECSGEASEEGRASQRTARYRSLQSLVGANKMGSRRRASIAAIPRMPGRVDAFILPSHMDVGGMGRVSAAGSLATSSAAPTATAVTEGENERRRESFASQIFSFGNSLPLESPEKPSWSVTPPGEEEDETNVGDDMSEPGASSWDSFDSSMVESGDGCAFNSLPNSNEDSRRCKRRSVGAGDVLVYRRDGLTARTEGKGNKDRWTISSTLTMVRPYLSLNISTLSTVFREWLGRWIKTPWLSQSGSLALVQEKGLTLLHARHCLTCILLVVAVLSLGATIVSTDAHIDRWHRLKDYQYELGKILRPYVTLSHYTRPPM